MAAVADSNVRLHVSADQADGLRVLFVANSWPDEQRPWYGIAMKKQAESLQALGIGIDVLSIRGYASRRAYVEAAARVARLNRRRGWDIVHAHYGHAAMVARMHVRSPLIITYLGSDLLAVDPVLNGLSRRAQLEAQIFRRLALTAAATITQSEEMERVLPASCRARNHVIPEGVDLERFAPLPRAQSRRRLGWDERERVVLFVADPRRPEKNFGLAQAVCQRLADTSVPELKLRVVAGVDPAEVPVWLSAADALLLTSYAEGGPSVIKEAMAVELPSVSTPVGITRECLSGLPGLWVRPPSVEPLADALEQALQGGRVPEARTALGRILSLETVARRVAGVYELVAARTRARRADRAARSGRGL